MNLTILDIKADIIEYQSRIQKAQQRLDDLPAGYLPYIEHKAREKRQRDLQDDIRHYAQLIIYATTGISIRQQGV